MGELTVPGSVLWRRRLQPREGIEASSRFPNWLLVMKAGVNLDSEPGGRVDR